MLLICFQRPQSKICDSVCYTTLLSFCVQAASQVVSNAVHAVSWVCCLDCGDSAVRLLCHYAPIPVRLMTPVPIHVLH